MDMKSDFFFLGRIHFINYIQFFWQLSPTCPLADNLTVEILNSKFKNGQWSIKDVEH